MLWSAASLVLAIVVSDGQDLSDAELKAWKRIEPSVIFLLDGPRVRGAAALISRDGYFLTHATAVNRKTIEARKSDGSIIKLRWVTTDEPTQFVLLKDDAWNSDCPPFEIANPDISATKKDGNERLLALTATGPVRAERGKETFGIVNPSRRVVPMNEVFLENNLPTLGGSLLFNMRGELSGALNAALGMSEGQNVQKSRAGNDALPITASGGFGGGDSKVQRNSVTNQYGPGILTAAYTIGPKVLKRVVSGFLSEDHSVKHPAIGIFCRDALPQGALIDSVTKNSPADKAGLVKNDILLKINNQPVRNQIDFARIMANQEPGELLRIELQRGKLITWVTVEVGTQP